MAFVVPSDATGSIGSPAHRGCCDVISRRTSAASTAGWSACRRRADNGSARFGTVSPDGIGISLAPYGHDVRAAQIIVVDDDDGVLPRDALAEVDLLSLAIAMESRLGRIHRATLRQRSQVVIPQPLDTDEHRVIPVGPKFRAVEEHAVEHEDCAGGRSL